MFYIIEVVGTEPYLNVMLDDDPNAAAEGMAKAFTTRVEAEDYAEENCSWDYQVIEF